MSMDTVTLRLHGEDISLDKFAQAAEHFALLMKAISTEGEGEDVRWQLSDLVYSSAVMTAQGNGTEPDQVDRAVRSYALVGKALRDGSTDALSKAVRTPALGISKVIGNGVSAALFETPEDDFKVTEPTATPTKRAPDLIRALGAVTGRIQTLSSRSALRFTLYDRLYGRAVSCYLKEGQEEMARDAWDKYARVEGEVWRDPETGWPTSVRNIMAVEKIEDEGTVHGYRRARGAWHAHELSPEERIRRLRDAT
jgi:hypothetical protein